MYIYIYTYIEGIRQIILYNIQIQCIYMCVCVHVSVFACVRACVYMRALCSLTLLLCITVSLSTFCGPNKCVLYSVSISVLKCVAVFLETLV